MEHDKKVYTETTREYHKQFFQKNKDKKYHCELCNCDISIFNQAHHRETKKHQSFLEKKQFLEEKKEYIKTLEEKNKYIKTLLEEKNIIQ